MGMYKKIFADQCGYLPALEKKVTFVSDREVEFCVRRSDGTGVFEGKSTKPVYNEATKETECQGDFSEVQKPGMYYVTVQGLGESDIFEIGEHVYDELFQKSVYFYYLQRCGQELTKKAAGIFGHKACHTENASIYGADGRKEVTGGCTASAGI